MKTVNTAQNIVISSAVTVTILLGLLYIARFELREFLREQPLAPEKASSAAVYADERIIQAIEKANPAVVSIVITKDVPVYERYYEVYEPRDFFGGLSIPRVRTNGTQEQEVGGGSGFIVSNDGLIVTNRHVVDDESARYTVLLNDGLSYDVKVLARDPQFDIAILQIDQPLETALPYLTFGDSDTLRLGEPVIAIGNALAEFRNSVSVGVVSGLLRSIVATDAAGRSEQLDQVIQTDAAINPGNSGGPLLNRDGDVVGVNVAVSRGADNIGFALPAEVVQQIVTSVKETGEITRPFLGVRYTMLTPAIAEQNNLPVTSGAWIVPGPAGQLAILPGSPAAKAGLKAGDVIARVDDIDIADRDIATVLRSKTVGQKITLTVVRDGGEEKIELELEKAVY